MHILPGDLDHPAVIALLRVHVDAARAQTGPESAHALDLDGLRAAEISVWAVWEDERLLGVGALKRLSVEAAEVKSMHTAEAARGRGVGGAMLAHLIGVARAEGYERLCLETGSWDYFRPAWALYQRHGFVECGPFGDYRPDRNSRFMTLEL